MTSPSFTYDDKPPLREVRGVVERTVVDYRTALPATLQGMQRYLGSGMVKGIGPIYAARIVEAFGEETFDVIDATPERLKDVAGIGNVRAARIATTWAEQR